MNNSVTITGDGAFIELNCPLRIDHERGIQIPPEVLDTILQGEPERRVEWSKARLLFVNMDE